MPSPNDPMNLIRRLGQGKNPKKLSLSVDAEGYTIMHDILFPTVPEGIVSGRLGPFEIRSAGGRIVPTFEGLVFDYVDFTGSDFQNSRWVDCDFTHVKMNRINGFGMNFTNSRIRHSSFIQANLSRANWGWKNPPYPLVEDCTFERTDLRNTTHTQPIFRRCRFTDCRFKGTRLSARFEDCVFEGVVADVGFGTKTRDRGVTTTWNQMKNVDFTRAELRHVAFCGGIDLRSCKFPEKGYVHIPRPDLVYPRLLEAVRRSWSSPEREKVTKYLEQLIRLCFREEQPLDIINEDDMPGIFGEETGRRLVNELKQVSESIG